MNLAGQGAGAPGPCGTGADPSGLRVLGPWLASTPLPSEEESEVQGGRELAPNHPVNPQQGRDDWYVGRSRPYLP